MPDDALYKTPHDGFALLADTYDSRLIGDPRLLLETSATLAALPQLDYCTVADIGCGTGRYALQLSRLGARSVTGVDFCVPMREVAKRKAIRAELPVAFVDGDLTQPDGLPLDDDSVDVAVCALTLTFVPDLHTAFANLARCVRSGGVLVMSEWHPHTLRAHLAIAAAAMDTTPTPYLAFVSPFGDNCRILRHAHLSADYIHAALSSGLALEHISEPVADRRLAASHPVLRDQVGIPQAIILRFGKP